MDGEASNSGERRQKRPRQKRTAESISYEASVENLSREGKQTLRILNQKRVRPLNAIPDSSCALFDNTCLDYDWLHCGWIAEERLKPHDRLYRYYYDPLGQMYSARYEVNKKCAGIEKDRVVIIID